MLRTLISLFLCIFSILVQATQLYPFQSKIEKERFETIIKQTRCLVCQNQSLADSNAPLAQDLRLEIYKRVIKGTSVDSIEAFLIERYGNFIFLKPRLNYLTYFLWFSPIVLFIFIGWISSRLIQ